MGGGAEWLWGQGKPVTRGICAKTFPKQAGWKADRTKKERSAGLESQAGFLPEVLV